MYLVNLSLGEFVTLFSVASAIVTALYLLDRSRRKHVVATLRFWTPAERPTEIRRRRRIRQPLSLALQLISIMLLLLAAAQLRWGKAEERSQDHVLILDTSAWMAARTETGTLMDQARAYALDYLRALPAEDRVMLIRAEAFATPVTAFESDRAALRRAVLDSRPGAGALHLEEALDFARRVQTMHARRPGEVAYAGCGRMAEMNGTAPEIPRLRVLVVKSDIQNIGIRKVGLRHSPTEADLWEMFVSVRNYGPSRRNVQLGVQFTGAPAGMRALDLPPGAEAEATFPLRTRAAGTVEVQLLPGDNFPGDDRAVIELPAQHSLKVVVYSERPEQLRAALEANPFLDTVYRKPGQAAAGEPADLVILDRCPAPAEVTSHAIWIEPPPGHSPAPVRGPADNAAVREWNGNHPIAAGLNTQDLELRSAVVFEAREGYEPVAAVAAGPVLLAWQEAGGPRKSVVLGFHPTSSSVRYQLAAPLLFANILRWMEPRVFRRWELNAGSVGAVEMPLGEGAGRASVRVVSEEGNILPATVQGDRLRFFSAIPGIVRVLAADREVVYSLNLPDVATEVWEPPATAALGIPAPREHPVTFRELWPWLVALATVLLAFEWLWFGRFRTWESGRRRAKLVTLLHGWRKRLQLKSKTPGSWPARRAS
jgi:hypothetical protein